MKKVIITGATGMVGKGVLLECLDHKEIGEALVVGRNPLGMNHPTKELSGYDACFFCMGISAAGLSEEQYRRVTHDYTLSLAKTLVEINRHMTFTYVSGQGTDSTEKGRIMWARVKGETENDLLNLGFKQAFMFRPGAIIPLRGIKSRTKLYQFMYDYFLWLVKGYKAISPNSVVDTTQMGLAMIHVMLKGYDKQVLEPKDIIQLSAK